MESKVQTARSWAGRHEGKLWTAVILAVVAIQWPMLKGYYYKAADTAPPAPAVEWRTDLDAALLEARATQKRVLVDFSADWCPPCIAMKHDVWPDRRVGRTIADGYVPVMIDVDTNGAVADRYNVRGIPTVLVLDHAGNVIKNGSFFTASSLVNFLTESD